MYGGWNRRFQGMLHTRNRTQNHADWVWSDVDGACSKRRVKHSQTTLKAISSELSIYIFRIFTICSVFHLFWWFSQVGFRQIQRYMVAKPCQPSPPCAWTPAKVPKFLGGSAVVSMSSANDRRGWKMLEMRKEISKDQIGAILVWVRTEVRDGLWTFMFARDYLQSLLIYSLSLNMFKRFGQALSKAEIRWPLTSTCLTEWVEGPWEVPCVETWVG